MKRVIYIALFSMIPLLGYTQNIIWQEIFSGDVSAGATVDNGTTAWSIYPTGPALKVGGRFDVQNDRFEAFNIMQNDGGPDYMVWMSEYIDISSYDSVAISFDFIVTLPGFEDDADTLRATYEVNGGSEVIFFEDWVHRTRVLKQF